MVVAGTAYPEMAGGDLSWLHLQGGGVGGGLDSWLVHGAGLGGADHEFTWVDDFEQIDVGAAAGEFGVEEGGAVVVEFSAGEPLGPPVWLVVEGVELAVFEELGAGRDRVFGEEVFPVGAVDGELDGYGVAYVDRALERDEVVGDGVVVGLGWFFFSR